MLKRVVFLLLLFAFAISCEKSTGPDTDLELTKVGNEFGVYINLEGAYIDGIEDSVVIVKNESGIVTVSGIFTTNIETLRRLDTVFNTYLLPEDIKHQIIDNYLQKFGLTIDTTNPQEAKVYFSQKFKVTSEGMQDFTYSKGDLSKPFTMFKYSSAKGDKYEFTTDEGEKIMRTVIQTHTTEDWELGFLMVKTMRVEQYIPNDPVFKKVIFVANHKYGLVGVIYELNDGRTLQVTIMPWSVLK